MNRRRVVKAKAETGMNPLWAIAAAMAIFFAVAAILIGLG